MIEDALGLKVYQWKKLGELFAQARANRGEYETKLSRPPRDSRRISDSAQASGEAREAEEMRKGAHRRLQGILRKQEHYLKTRRVALRASLPAQRRNC